MIEVRVKVKVIMVRGRVYLGQDCDQCQNPGRDQSRGRGQDQGQGERPTYDGEKSKDTREKSRSLQIFKTQAI